MPYFHQLFTRIAPIALATASLAATACADNNTNEPEVETPEPRVVAVIDPAPVADAEPPEGLGEIIVADNIREACELDAARAYFAYDSAEIRSSARPMLERIADCFTSGPMQGEELDLTGHADPRGSEAYNQELGRERAESVADFLEREGLSQARLGVDSEGESQASDDPDEWSRNRKVVIELQS